MKCLSDGNRLAVELRSQTQEVFPLSPGKCNFQNHLQPKHERGAARELFLKMGYKQAITQICT